MGQLTQSVIFFNDLVGNVEAGSKHTFFESGTTTPKSVYSDPDLLTPIVQPVIADSRGILPQIWLESGAYRWVGADSDDVIFFTRDNINLAETTIITSASFAFENELNLSNLILTNGDPVNPQDGQSVFTQGGGNRYDGNGRQFVVGPTNLGGGIFLANGKYANPLTNFQSSDDVDAAITDHNDDPAAHSYILNRIEPLKYFVMNVSNFGNDFGNVIASVDGVECDIIGSAKLGTGDYRFQFTNTVNITSVNILPITSGLTFGSANGTPGSNKSVLEVVIKNLSGVNEDASFSATVWYTGTPTPP